jgi:hypothetical protein
MISDEGLKYLSSNVIYSIPIPVGDGNYVTFIDIADMARELLHSREANRWILNDERTPEVGEIVQWTHKSWKRVKEGYLTDTAHLKVWGGEYASVPKGAMWKPMPEPPEST